MRIHKVYFFLVFIFLGIPQIAFGVDSNLVLNLSKIEKIQATEESGDELYFSITEYSSKVHPKHYVVPPFPTHWLSDYLSQLKDVQLWERKLVEGEAVTVLVSLIEGDVPPWNVDDLIGTVKFKARHAGDKIEIQWTIPNQEYAKKIQDAENSFLLVGDGGEYRVAFTVKSDLPIKKAILKWEWSDDKNN